MEELKKVLYSEIEDFREKGHKFIKGELNVMQFKHSSGGFGIYAHKGGKEFMIRLRIPSGVTNVSEMTKVYKFIEKYGLDKIHFTTRQAIQLHGLSIDEVCDLMKEALDNDIYTRGAGGNFPRNVAISPLSGVDKDEEFDVTPYALEVGNHFLKKIYTYKLPRKLKVSFSSTMKDEAHCTVQDLGFLAVKKDDKKYFQVYLGGGLGQNPKMAVKYPELIDTKEVLYHIEGMTNLFIAEGDYENRNKARVRYILDRLGEEEFLKTYKKHVDEAKVKGDLDLVVNEIKVNKKGIKKVINNSRVVEQKQEGLYSVYLHPTGGQLGAEDLKVLIETLDGFDNPEIRLAMTEGIYFRNLNGDEAEQLLKITEDMGGNTALKQSVACIGAPTCQIGMCNSQETLNAIINYFEEKKVNKDILPTVHISGCGNSCGVHQIGSIGFTGKKKRVGESVQECFSLFIGGAFGVNNAKMGICYGDILASRIPELLYELAVASDNKDIKFNDFVTNHKAELETIVNKYLV